MARQAAADWTLLRLAGPDGKQFLQGHLTCDVHGLDTKQALLAAACNLKGRVIASMYVFYDATDYYLFLPQATQSILLAFWQPYFGLYRQAQMLPCSGPLYLVASADRQTGADLRLSFNAQLDLVLMAEQHMDAIAESWDHFLIKQKIPHVLAEGSGQWTPQMLNYDEHGAISYDKGCYLGQEVVARIHYRGRSNRSCYAVAFSFNEPVKINMAFYNAKGDKVGELVNFYALNEPSDAADLYHGLAVLNNNVADRQSVYLDTAQRFPVQVKEN